MIFSETRPIDPAGRILDRVESHIELTWQAELIRRDVRSLEFTSDGRHFKVSVEEVEGSTSG